MNKPEKKTSKTTTNISAKAPESLVFRWVVGLSCLFITVLGFVVWYADFSLLSMLTILPLFALLCFFCVFHIKHILESHFFSLANVIESLRMKEYATRLAMPHGNEAWTQVLHEIDELAKGLSETQITAVESGIILDKLLAEFDIPVFVFDRHDVLSNINHAAEQLFDRKKEHLLGLNTHQLMLTEAFEHSSGHIFKHWFPNKGGRWELRKNYFIQNSQRYTLILINDLSKALREEERLAWQRLLRVLGHELNNSLASIISVSDTLSKRLHEDKDDKWLTYYEKAVSVINERSQSLSRFAESYAKVGKLPSPNKEQCRLEDIVSRVCNLLTGSFDYSDNTDCQLEVDPDQLEQMLINLLKNAVEASSVNLTVSIKWEVFEQGVMINIIDAGKGLPMSDNLFVPFFSTKENGNGIGLFLCRQIAEAHGGTLALLPRRDKQGCIAQCWLPIQNH